MKIKENKSFFRSQSLPNLNNRPMTATNQKHTKWSDTINEFHT